MRPRLSALLAWVMTAAPVSAMSFVLGGTDHRTADAAWIQATGPIEITTLEDFRAFLDDGGDWYPKRIRFDSPGGDLGVGVQLGEELRRLGFATEVGGHEPHPDWPDMPYWEFTRRVPGDCASACAYAFMGGVERRIDVESRVGVHQFYTPPSASQEPIIVPVLVQEGEEQEIVSHLLDFTLRMGVDGRVLVNASQTAPKDMYWITQGSEAQNAGLEYAPQAWSEWGIELLGQGVIAESRRADGQYQMAALCTEEGGGYFDLFVLEERTEQSEFSVRNWLLDQCVPAGSASQGPDAHRILGNRVSNSDIRFVDRPGGFGVRFPLGRNPNVDGGPSFLSEDAAYGACVTDRFLGNEAKMKASIQVAFRNCIQ